MPLSTRKGTVILLVAATATVGAAGEDPTALTPQQVIQQVGDAVVLIEARSEGALGQGTGFVVEGGVVVTCLHVIDTASGLAVVLRDGTRLEDVYVRAFDIEHDLVVLVVDLPVGDARPPAIAFGDTTAVEPGGRITTIGHPLGLEHTVTEGLVSAWREPPEEDSPQDPASRLLLPPSRLLQISAEITHGSSGGPVLNERGEAIGVATSGVVWEGVSTKLNFAVPVDALPALLEQNDAMDLLTFRERVDDMRRVLARPLYESAELAYELENIEKAARELERALRIFPRYEDALLLSGSIAKENGQFDVAEKRFKLATEVDPYSADAWYRLGDIHRLQAAGTGVAADLSRAETAFETALELDGRHARAALGVAMIKMLKGSLERAEQLLLSAIDNDPYLAEAYYTLGLLYLQTDRADEALDMLEQARRVNPDHAMTHFGLAILYMNLEIATLRSVSQHGRSAEHWREFLRLSEDDPTLADEREAAASHIRRNYPGLLD